MRHLLLVRPAAEADLAAARDWYEQRRPGLGGEFLGAMAGAMHELAKSPESHRLYYRNFRRVLLRRFPFKIFYQVIGKRVVIFRVLHAKQDHGRRLA